MKRVWSTFISKFEALVPRERWLAFGAALLVSVYTIFATAIEPVQKREKALRAEIDSQRTEIAARRNAPAAGTSGRADQDTAYRSRRQELTNRIGALDETLRALGKELVPADRVNALLQDLLRRDQGLRLVALRTMPAVPLLDRPPRAGNTPESTAGAASQKSDGPEQLIYRHGVELTIRGKYADLHGYLTRLENSPWRMFWSRAQLKSEGDAVLTMTLTIYTLSLDKAWLEV